MNERFFILGYPLFRNPRIARKPFDIGVYLITLAHNLCRVFLFWICCTAVLWSQPRPETKPRWGIWGQLGVLRNDAILYGFKSLPGSTPRDSTTFTQIDASGITFGVGYEHPFHEQISLSLRADYTLDKSIFLLRDSVRFGFYNGKPNDGYIDYTFYSQFHNIGLTPLVNWKPFRKPFSLLNGLTLSAGARVAYLIKTSIEQKERIVGQEFPGSVKERLTFADTAMPGAQAFQVALQAGISYDIPIALNEQDHLVLSPEIFAQMGMTTLTNEQSWKQNSLRAGISLKFFSVPERELLPPATIRTAPTATLNAQVLVAGIDKEQQEKPVTLLKVEEFVHTELVPLLPYIFFDLQSSAIPQRYHRLLPTEVRSFQEEQLTAKSGSGAPTQYYSLLNILGKRLQTHSSATITLVGCQDIQIGIAPDTVLPRERATSIKEYLQVVWNIQPDRIRLKVRGLPESRSSTPDAPSRSAEHHRVEIHTNESLLLSPIRITDTTRTVIPSMLRFYLKSTAEAGLTRWSFWANQAGNYLYHQTQPGSADSTFVWKISETPSQIPRSPGVMSYTFEVLDANDQYAQATGSLPVEILTVEKKRQKNGIDKELHYFRILFPTLDNGELSRDNLRIIDDLIRPLCTNKTTITLKMVSDFSGMSQEHRAMLEKRATLITKRLSAVNPLKILRNPIEYVTQSYNTSQPEEKIYSRYIEIFLEKPVW